MESQILLWTMGQEDIIFRKSVKQHNEDEKKIKCMYRSDLFKSGPGHFKSEQSFPSNFAQWTFFGSN